DANFVNALEGKVAGVTINSSSTGIGGATRVGMRGPKSLFGNNNALYVIDGIPMPPLASNAPVSSGLGGFGGSNMTSEGSANLNPDESGDVAVLTGAAASALYGSQAANGAILITTKKGLANRTKVAYTNNTN